MRKIVAAETMSLDGVVSLEGNWHLPYFYEELARGIGAAMSQADALLMGRVNYEEWLSDWPNQDPEQNPMAGYMNSVRKYVVSTTLEEPLEWENSTLISANVAEEIASLKREDGRNISISGSATLVESLMEHDLVDEYRLMIFPVVVGKGRKLFGGDVEKKKMKLVDTQTFPTGVVVLTYEPQREGS